MNDRQPRPTSLRRSLLASIATTAVIAAGLTVLASRHFLQVEADELLDAQLARAARVFDAALATLPSDRKIVLDLPDFGTSSPALDLSRGHPYELHVVLQVVDPDNRVMIRSKNAPLDAIANARPGFSSTDSGWRIFVLESRHRDARIIVGEDDRARRELSLEFSATAVFTTLAGFGLLFLVMLIQIERGLKPVRKLAGNLAGRGLKDLEPVSIRRLPGEMQPLVGALNQYLGRLRKAFRSEQEFTTRAAHEMRTPLAALRIHAENALAADNEKDLVESLHSLLRGIERTSRLTNQLLLLTRLDLDQLRQRFGTVDIQNLCEKLLDGHRALAENHHLSLEIDTEPGLTLRGDPDLLLVALDTLVDNAVKHSPPGARIKINGHRFAQGTAIEVVDQGPGMTQALIQQVETGQFGRTRQTGTGIGLEIASWIAEAHGGALHIMNRVDTPGLVASLCIPDKPDSAPGRWESS
ncbi:MAG: ATP-binding protein [Wenzhouxiangellaceae bacterium]|nr:ATP-binding protein [Wenzhouxiangellaceae bacterium]